MISLTEAEAIFQELKDQLEYDSDIIAVYRVLTFELTKKPSLALDNWLYLLNHYNMKSQKQDIDFDFLTYEIPLKIIEIFGLTKFMSILSQINENNKFVINNNLFSTYNNKRGIYEIFESLILKGKYQEELNLLNELLVHAKSYPKEIFDITKLLNNLIMFHLESNKYDKAILSELIKKAPSSKDQALLKSLLID